MRPAIAALGLLLSTSLASAADLGGPIYGGSMKDDFVAPIPSWTGLYFGGHVGYGWGEWDGTLTYDEGAGPVPIWADPTQSIDSDGWLGGLQIGFNRQHGAFVWGLEADVSWTEMDGSGAFDTADGFYRWRIKQELDWFGTVRARLGFLPMHNLLIYATGGVAYGETSANHTAADLTNFGFISGRGSADEKHIGWVAGAGGELMLAPNWIIRAEWLHVDLGHAEYHLKGTNYYADPPEPYSTDSFPSDLKFDVFRVGLNYKFGLQ